MDWLGIGGIVLLLGVIAWALIYLDEEDLL